MGMKMKWYFIGGLGCNPLYPQEFLRHVDLEVTYLDLYAEANLFRFQSIEEVRTWFEDSVDMTVEIGLIAHSLGAEFALDFAALYPQIKRLVLLDGGFFDIRTLVSLEDELSAAMDYLAQSTYQTLEEAVALEKSEAPYWSDLLEQAARDNWLYDEKEQIWRLAISKQVIQQLLTIRHQQLHVSLTSISRTSICLLTPQVDEMTPEWKRRL